jgi:hypothetical protein
VLVAVLIKPPVTIKIIWEAACCLETVLKAAYDKSTLVFPASYEGRTQKKVDWRRKAETEF